ncbi:ras and EF-hand domain-containing protein homolog [Tachypleus tridentatus]|uniref:ras and EF-hand domain-containing protein homolog n=1 Tax=Tachypleus tridentatus TaxID=6853 RepID=UPI003FD626F1
MASAELENLFKACDTRGTGYLGQDEVRELCAKFGIISQDADAIFEDLDHDGDGKIDFEDFSKGFTDFLTLSSTPPTKDTDIAAQSRKQPFDPDPISCLDSEKKQIVFQAWQNLTTELGKAGNLISEEKLLSLYKELQTTERPHLVKYFETVIGDLLENVRKLQEENEQLESSWKREKKEHEQYLHRLEEELDSQVKDVELQAKKQAQAEVEAERRSLKLKMDAEMDELHAHLSLFEKVDSWLKDSQDPIKEGKLSEIRTKLEDSVYENRQLRMSLMDTQTSVALMRSEIAQLRSQYEEKCRELISERERVLDILHEHEQLSRHLHLLHDANKRLQDTNDNLREVVDVDTYHKKASHTRLDKRGSIIGDYLCAEATPMELFKTKNSSIDFEEEEDYSLTEDVDKYRQMSLTSSGVDNDIAYKMDSFVDDFDSGLSTLRDITEPEATSDYGEENDNLKKTLQSPVRKQSFTSIQTQSSSRKSSLQDRRLPAKPKVSTDCQTMLQFDPKAKGDIFEKNQTTGYSSTDTQSEGDFSSRRITEIKRQLGLDPEIANFPRQRLSKSSTPVSSVDGTPVPTPRISLEKNSAQPRRLPPRPPVRGRSKLQETTDLGNKSDVNNELVVPDVEDPDIHKEQAAPVQDEGRQQQKLKELEELDRVENEGVSFEPTGPPERTYKIVFVGDAAVGKSSLIIRLSKGVFMETLTSTLGVDFQMKSLRVDNRNVAVQLWDTAGQERFRSMTQSYFRKADGIMLVYDCTSEYSFLNVRQWMEAVDDVTTRQVPVMIVANKTDRREMARAENIQCVSTEVGEKLAKEFGAFFIEVSAKTGRNVLESVVVLTRAMTATEENQVQSSGLNLEDKTTSKSLTSNKCQRGCSK